MILFQKFPYVFKDVETNETTGLLYDIWKLCEEYLKFKYENKWECTDDLLFCGIF